MTTTDPFTEAARAEAENFARTPRMNVGTVRDRIAEAHLAGAEWGREQALAQEPTEDEVEAGEESIDCLFGWEHLRRYGGQSEEWMNQLRKSITRNVLSAARRARGGMK